MPRPRGSRVRRAGSAGKRSDGALKKPPGRQRLDRLPSGSLIRRHFKTARSRSERREKPRAVRDIGRPRFPNSAVKPSLRHLEARRRRWQVEVTDELPALLARLLSADECSAAPPRTHGVYLFSERGKPMYVGRTGKTERSIAKGGGYSNFRTRRAAHTHPRHNEGTYAYRLALDSFAEAGGVRGATRVANCADPAFMEHFRKQCQRVKEMEFRVVEIGDDRLAAVFEVYASAILRTKNSWATS